MKNLGIRGSKGYGWTQPGVRLSPATGYSEGVERVMASKLGITVAVVAIGGLPLLDDVVEGEAPGAVDLAIAAVVAVIAALTVRAVVGMARSRERAREHARHNAEVLGTVQALHTDPGDPGVMSSLVEHVTHALRADLAAAMILDEEDPTYIRSISSYRAPDGFEGMRWPADHGLSGRVIATGEPAMVADYSVVAKPIPMPEDFVPRGAMAAPMQWGGEVRAALVVVSGDERRRFNDADLKILSRMAALGSLAMEHAEMRAQLQRTLRVGAHALIAAVNARDEYTAEHSESVVALARAVGEQLGLPEERRSRLEAAARLHDVGKLAIPDAILSKPGPLDEEEWAIMRRHPDIGADLLEHVPGLDGLAPIVRAEHERWDGRGYPRGLAGEEIPIEARIVFACDAFHAMTSDRPYRAALSEEEAIAELRANAGTQFDARVVEALLELVGDRAVAVHAAG